MCIRAWPFRARLYLMFVVCGLRLVCLCRFACLGDDLIGTFDAIMVGNMEIAYQIDCDISLSVENVLTSHRFI